MTAPASSSRRPRRSARDPRAARDPVRRRRARLRGARPPGPVARRSRPRACGRQGSVLLAEAAGRPVLGVDTAVVLGRARLREALRRAPRRARCSRRSPAGRTRSSPGSASSAASVELRRARHDPCDVPAADRAADRRLRGDRRMGGPRGRLRDPGPRRGARRADRGRLPERRRSSRRAASSGCWPEHFPRRLRLRPPIAAPPSATPYT